MSNDAHFPVSRRRLLGAASLLPLAAFVPDLIAEAKAAPASVKYRFFTTHQAAVIDAATRRLVPGPEDDPLEAGHPGAHEANVVRYIDTMLGIFTFDPPRIFTGGPWSNRKAPGENYMADFTPPDVAQAKSWRQRIDDLQSQYSKGIKLLDSQASGDFTKAIQLQQDGILASSKSKAFTAVLFEHTIEGMYSNPEYGGNQNLVGWNEIGYPGDSQPVGYNADEMSQIDYNIVDPTGIVSLLLDNFSLAAQAMASGKHRA